MGHFGDELRRERETRGVTLETISEKTKVITRYLSALENDDFSALPGGILSKGIVRGYVRTVGLDESVWIERFLNATQKAEPAPDRDEWVEFVENIGRTRAHNHRARLAGKRLAGIAVLLLLLVGFGWIVWRYVSGHVMADELPGHAITATAAAAPQSHAAQ